MEYLFDKIVVISDNAFLINSFETILHSLDINLPVAYYCSPVNQALLDDKTLKATVRPLIVKQDWQTVVTKSTIVFSLHCKQLFPAELVAFAKCINVHPGFNPYNRGWYPQVFAILNKNKVGATIHEIDEQLDHGPIICRQEVPINSWETSLDVYNKIQDAEVVLLKEYLKKILTGNYTTMLPEEEGNVNLKKDFNQLREIDLNKQATVAETIDYFRAMTHGDFKNLYFIDADGQKVYVNIKLTKDSN